MPRIIWVPAALLAVLTAGTLAYQQWAGRRAPDLEQALAAQGGKLYAIYCDVCHGGSMEGTTKNLAPPLVKGGFRVFFRIVPNGMEGFVMEQIREGTPGMPPFRNVLNKPELEALAVFIRLGNTRPGMD